MGRSLLTAAALVLAAATATPALVVPGYAIVGARVVTGTGQTLARATVVIREGVIAGVTTGSDAPGDVERIDGDGLRVYPGLIDLFTRAGVSVPTTAAPQDPATREISELWRRRRLLQGDVHAADHYRPDASRRETLLAAGITNALIVPGGEAIAGQSALVQLAEPEIDPQVSRIAVDLRGAAIVQTPVALHVSFPSRGVAGTYPASLMGGIAFVRQAFVDARRYEQAQSMTLRPAARPPYDAALSGMAAAVTRRMPVAFEASSPREIRRALALALELSLDPIIVGGHGAGEVIAPLKEAGARVIVLAAFPERDGSLAPDADEPLREIEARAAAREAAAALAAAGVPFGFGSHGLKDAAELVKRVGVAVEHGLTPDAAVTALTSGAARIAGADDRLGAVVEGRMANLIVTDGDLFAQKTSVTHVFVDGRRVLLP